MKFVPTTLDDRPEFVQAEILKFASWQPRPERFQLDILDGHFADNVTVEPGIAHDLNMGGMALDLHLMVVEPLEWLREIRECPAVDIVIAQVERMTSIEAYVDEVINEMGYRVGLALDLYTPFEAIPEELLPQISVVQIMGNKAGFQGLTFKENALDTIAEAAAARQKHGFTYDISVDIGMNDTTIPQVEEAGATMVAIGSYLSGDDGAEHWKLLHS